MFFDVLFFDVLFLAYRSEGISENHPCSPPLAAVLTIAVLTTSAPARASSFAPATDDLAAGALRQQHPSPSMYKSANLEPS